MTLVFLVSCPISFLLIWLKVMVITVWARLLVAFIWVAATVLLAVPVCQNEDKIKLNDVNSFHTRFDGHILNIKFPNTL